MTSSKLDVAFCVDNTGSMGTYIAQVQQNIVNIVKQIIASEKADVRVGYVTYRDFTDDYVARVHPFTSSFQQMLQVANGMAASGGGDGPEAVATGLHKLMELDWRKEATKIVIFIADAPPHGLERHGDSYPNGGPDKIDPMEAANALVRNEIIVYSVGCEPAINSFTFARDFMKAVADMTGGKYISLAQANILADVIVGGAKEEIQLEKLAQEIEKEAAEARKVRSYANEADLYTEVTNRLQARNVQTSQCHVDEVVPQAAFVNAGNFAKAQNLQQMQSQIGGAAPATSQLFSVPSPYASSISVPRPMMSAPSFAPPPTSSSYSSLPPPATFGFGAPPTSAPTSSLAPPPSAAYAPSAYGGGMPQMQQQQQVQSKTDAISYSQVQRLLERNSNRQQQQQMAPPK